MINWKWRTTRITSPPPEGELRVLERWLGRAALERALSELVQQALRAASSRSQKSRAISASCGLERGGAQGQVQCGENSWLRGSMPLRRRLRCTRPSCRKTAPWYRRSIAPGSKGKAGWGCQRARRRRFVAGDRLGVQVLRARGLNGAANERKGHPREHHGAQRALDHRHRLRDPSSVGVPGQHRVGALVLPRAPHLSPPPPGEAARSHSPSHTAMTCNRGRSWPPSRDPRLSAYLGRRPATAVRRSYLTWWAWGRAAWWSPPCRHRRAPPG